jgi:hypothetical protein
MSLTTDSSSNYPEVFVSDISRYQKNKELLTLFWITTISLLLYELYLPTSPSLIFNFLAVLITIFALLPTYLWCSGKALGLPVFPLFALTYIWSFALPLLVDQRGIEKYSLGNYSFAALTTAAFLGLGTLIWFQWVKSTPPPPKYYLTFGSRKGDQFFFFALGFGILYNVAISGGLLTQLESGGFSIIRSLVVSLSSLSIFLLSYRFGRYELDKKAARWFVFLIIAFMFTGAVSFLLNAISIPFGIFVFAFTLGRKKVPIRSVIIVAILLTLLQSGKADMRAKYWRSSQSPYVQFWEYPAVYVEWAESSFKYFGRDQKTSTDNRENPLERSNVIRMLMIAQSKSPELLPFLYGKSYAVLPQVIIPRFLNSDRIPTNVGTHILSIYYGLQTPEDTQITAIAWGLLAESYGNFGLLGCAGLAVVLGGFYGWVTRWSINTPIMSAQSLFTMMMMTLALIQTELVASSFVPAITQFGMVLVGVSLFFMDSHSTKSNYGNHS